jgi:hypothetical protein
MLRIAINLDLADLDGYLKELLYEANMAHADLDMSRFPEELETHLNRGVELLLWKEPVVVVDSDEAFVAAVVLGDDVELYGNATEARRDFDAIAKDIEEQDSRDFDADMRAEDRERTLSPAARSVLPFVGDDAYSEDFYDDAGDYPYEDLD